MKLRQKEHRIRRERVSTTQAVACEQSPRQNFDIHEYLSENDYLLWLKYIKDERAHNASSQPDQDPGDFISSFAQLRLLFPEHQTDLREAHTSYSSDQKQIHILDDLRRINDWKGFMYYAANLCILYPERRAEFGLDEEVLLNLRTRMHTRLEMDAQTDREEAIHIAARLCILYPERRAEFGLDEDAFTKMKEALEAKHDLTLYKFSMLARDLCIIFPERKNDLQITVDDIEIMKRQMQEARDGGHPYNLRTYAYALMFITAEQVQITPTGIQFSESKSLTNQPALPDRNLAI